MARVRGHATRTSAAPLSPSELREQITRLGTWMYRFDLGDGVYTPLHDDSLALVHETRARMIFPRLDQLLGSRWADVACLDAACNEGYFGFELAKRGARTVVGFDARERNIEKAQLVKRQLSVRNIEFRVDDIFNLRSERYGSFELTLCLGLLYHLENPMGALRALRDLTREWFVIDTEVLRDGGKVSVYRGSKDGTVETDDVLGIVAEPEWEWNQLASMTGVSFVPSKSGLLAMLHYAGFTEIEVMAPYPACHPAYARGDRIIAFARTAS